jgi:outer membrane protein assembly factor BamB
VSEGVIYQPYIPRPCDYGSRTGRGFIVAMKVRGGRQLWRFRVSSESSLLLRQGVLYFGAWDRNVYALRVRDRKVLWRFRGDDELNSSPAYANGTIYIGSNGGSLYALDASTGRLRWRARSFSSRRWGREQFYATPTVAYGRVFVGNSDGFEYAFGATTGRLLWARRIGSYVYSAAAVWRKRIYVGSYDGGLYALDAATGEVTWRFQAASAVHGAPTVLNGVVYFSSCGTCGHRGARSGKLGARRTYAVDARNGNLLWTFPDGRYSPVAADSERLYVAGDTRVHGFVPASAPPPAGRGSLPPASPTHR